MKRATTGNTPVGKPETAAPATTTTRTRKPTPKQAKIVKVKLEHPDLTTREIAAVCDTDHSHVVKTLQTFGTSPQQVKDYTTHRTAILQGLQARIIASITDADIKDSSLLQRMSAYGITYDKERLETGKTTANIGTLVAHIEAIQRGESGM